MDLRKLLQEKTAEIDKLRKSYNRKAFEQWHKEVELLLERAFGDESKHLKEFNRFNGRAGVYIMGDEAENEKRDQEGYFRDLEHAESMLKAMLFGMSIESTQTSSARPQTSMAEQPSMPVEVKIINQNIISVAVNVSISQIVDIVNNMDVDDAQKSEATTKLQELESELKKPQPKWEVIKKCLAWALGFSERVFLQLLPIVLKHYGY